MAFQVEAWWSANYNKYSIRDLQSLPVFRRFVQLRYPFEHASEDVQERFWVEREEVDIFEWTVKATGRFERFSHDRKLRQYHYEVRYADEESPIVISSWFQQEVEWGTISRDYGEYQVQEGWRLESPNRMFERFTIEKGIKRGFRAGIYPYKGEYERWNEQIWEIEDEKMFTKQWSKQGESGGETLNSKGDYTWGENWYSNSAKEEKKCWHKQGPHDWGHSKGQEGPTRWDHTWDIDAEDKYVEKIATTNGKDVGYRYWGQGKKWYKQEWEGLKLLEREDRCEEVVNSKFRTRLDNLYVSEHNGTLRQQQTLLTLLQFLPEFADRVKDLDNQRAEIHAKDRESIEQLFDSTEALRAVQDAQEKLTQDMLGAFRDQLNTLSNFNNFFLSSFEHSLPTLKMIGDILEDTSPHDSFVSRVEDWKAMPGTKIQKGNAAMELLKELEVTKREELAKFKGGIPKEELENAMNLLYQIMVKHDAVSDKIVELTHADDFKKKLDGFEDLFEEIHKNFQEEGDPNKLKEMLTLLLDYQPVHLHLLGRLHGYKSGETDSELDRINQAVSDTKGAPSLKNTRAKVRSGRPTRDNPFQTMDKNLGRLAPALQKLLAAVDAPKEDIEALSKFAERTVESAEPVEVLMDKTRIVLEVVLRADPCVDSHNAALKSSDEHLNKYFAGVIPLLASFPEGQLLVSPREELVAKSQHTEYFPPLVLKKAEALGEQVPVVMAHSKRIIHRVPALAEALNKFVPYFIAHLKTVNAPEGTVKALQEVAARPEEKLYPLNTLADKMEALVAQAEVAVPSVAGHNDALKKTDANINDFFGLVIPCLSRIPNGENLVKPASALVQQTASTVYFPPLLLAKSVELKNQFPHEDAHQERFRKPIPKLAETLSKFIPYFVNHLKSVDAAEDALTHLNGLAGKKADKHYPLEVLAEQAEALLAKAQESEEKLTAHNEAIKQSDDNLNRFFEETFPYYKSIEGADEVIIQPRKTLIEESGSTEHFPPLVVRKTQELLDHAGDVIDLLNALYDQIETITSEQTETTTLVEELQRMLNDKSELIDQLQKKIKELDKRIALLNEDLNAASKYKPLFEDRDAVATKLEAEVKDLHIKNTDLTLERDSLKAENGHLAQEVKDLKNFKLRALDLEQENVRLQGIIKSYDQVLGGKKAQFETIVDNLNRELSEKDANIKGLLDKIAVLEKELNNKDRGRKRQLMLRVIGQLSNTLKVERTSTFLLWKFTSMGPEDVPPESVLDEVPECAGFKDETLVEPELQSFRDTESPLVEERKQQISANIIAKHWRLSASKFAKPSRPHEALSFWDKLLDSKFEMDKEDLEAGKRPLLLSEFTLEHLLKTIGNRRSVQDLLGSHLPTLYRLAMDGQAYAALLARMMQLFLGSPAPLEGQVLVTRYRKLFHPLFEAYFKSRTERKLPGKSELDLAASGGEALLSTVLDSFYGDLSGANFVVEHWLRHIKPASLSLQKFILYLVNWKVRSAGGNVANFWSAADRSGSGKTSGAEFAAAVHGLGLLISTRLLNEASETPIKKELFDQMVTAKLDDDEFVVTKANFLTGVLEAFLARVRRAAVVYTGEFAKKGKAHLGKDDFVATSSALEPGHDASIFEKIFEEGLHLSGTTDGVDSQAFVRVWLRHLIMPISHLPAVVPEMHLLTDSHVLEYNLETGIKSTTTTIKTTRTVTTTKKVIPTKATK